MASTVTPGSTVTYPSGKSFKTRDYLTLLKLPRDVAEQLRARAAQTGTTVDALVADACRAALTGGVAAQPAPSEPIPCGHPRYENRTCVECGEMY